MIDNETDVIFREVQRFSLWLRWMITISMVLAIVIDCVALQKKSSQQAPPDILPTILLIAVGILLPIAVSVLFWLLKLETEVRTDGLYIRFFPFHIQYKKFTAEDLSEYYARTYRPILEYGGWGIRCGWRGGRAYNVSGNKGVQLVLKNGKRLLIGSQKAEELADALGSLTQTG
ncbi:MAG: hypothetical protein JSV99_02975 [Planctomycetota bacterium]|nr:MAG: hypothetical protein JSV99_02975 [Planctomycetota bacterium]